MKIIIKSFLLILLLTSELRADEVRCHVLSGTNDKNSLIDFTTDCKTVKEFASEKEIKNKHKKETLEKLSKELALQVKQSSEELSLLTTFFSSNDQDLLMNSDGIKLSCRVSNLDNVENCNGKRGGDFQTEKLAMLKKELAKNSNISEKESIANILGDKYVSDLLGIKPKEPTLECPINEKSTFPLTAQLTANSGDLIVRGIKTALSSSNTNALKEEFLKYPHLKIIYEADEATGSGIKKDFIEYIQRIPAGVNSNKYISDFLFDKENQKKGLARSVASGCDRTNRNIKKFLCEDISEMASLNEEVSGKLYDKLNTIDPLEDQYDVEYVDKDGKYTGAYIAYGLQCIAKENKLNPQSLMQNPGSVDNWFSNFSTNVRAENDTTKNTAIVNSFCSFYKCEEASIKSANSCRKGGPISYKDLSAKFSCGDPDAINFPDASQGKDCNDFALQQISYLKGLNKMQTMASGDDVSIDETGNSSSREKRRRLPDFAENYLGAERTLKALGLPITPVTIAQKEEDFKERNLNTSTTPYIPNETKPVKSPEKIAATTNKENTTTSSSSIAPAYNPTRAVSAAVSTNVTAKSEGKSVAIIPKSGETTSTKEEVELRKQLEEEINKLVKSRDGVKNQIIENDDKITKAKSSVAGPDQYLLAEKERLRNRALDLDERERKLRDEYRALDEKIASRMEAAASAGGVAAGPKAQGIGSGGDIGAKAAKEAAPALLTANKGEQKPNTAAMIQSDKESKPISTEELATLSSDGLKQLGINTDLPFTLRVNFDNKVHEIQVKSITDNGKPVLAPVLNPKEKKLKAFLLKTTLFKPYVEYRLKNGGSLVDSF